MPSSLAASSSKMRMNSVPMILRFCSGSVTPLQLREEALLGVDRDQRHVEVVAERGDHLIALVLAHQPVVDEHAGQPVADRPVDEQRRDARVDAARERADRPAVADLLADPLDLLLDHRARAPGAVGAADVDQEVPQHLLAVGRVHDLGVELDAVDPALDRTRSRRPVRRSRTPAPRTRAAPRRRCRGATSSTPARSGVSREQPCRGCGRSAASARTRRPRRPRRVPPSSRAISCMP